MSDVGARDDDRPSATEKVNLVLEGGGAKGIALVGALSALEEDRSSGRKVEIRRLAGTSAGAIVVALRAAGYTPKELTDIITGPEIAKFTDPSFKLPVIGPAYGILNNLGMYKGDYFLDFIRSKLLDKGVRTFGDLVDRDYMRLCERACVRPQARWKYKAHIVASDITRGRMLIIPDDLNEWNYGYDPDHMDVALAVRMSMSIPFVFMPVRTRGRSGTASIIVDGGLLSNFPLEIFDPAMSTREWDRESPYCAGMVANCPDEVKMLQYFLGVTGIIEEGPSGSACRELWDSNKELLRYLNEPKTLGIRIIQGGPHDVKRPWLALKMLYALTRTAIDAHDISTTEKFEELRFARTIDINTDNVPVTKFDLPALHKEMLYDRGHRAMKRFMRDKGLSNIQSMTRHNALAALALLEKKDLEELKKLLHPALPGGRG
ncbi:patatin-like phospholipase family protein [Sorangium sp. So ce124]|uniref:patatin-like phospholipase family protein n=1 Tax=Sorangium sp. So ce124 TaxID=3133280 RepID=UPI003F6073FA